MEGSGTLDLQQPARKARADAERGRGWYAWLARFGLVAKGISFGIVGALAVKLAFGEGGKATSRQGALATLADESWGKVLLIALAVGFASYALWRLVQAVAERDEEGDAKGWAKKWGKRAGYIGRGAIYAGLTWTVIQLVTEPSVSEESQNQQAKEWTARVLEWPAGRWIVGIVGLAILGAGVWNAYRAVTRKFEDKWRWGRMSGAEKKWGGRIGVVGHLARGVVFGLIGIFIAKAALEYDPKESIGLDGALQKLVSTTQGPYLLGLTAAGLIAYGLFCLIDARYRDVSANSGQ